MNAFIGFAKALTLHPTSSLPSFAFAWLEGTEAVRLMYIKEVPDWCDLKTWPAGRLFGDRGEYQWRYRNDKLHAVLLLDDQPLPIPFAEDQKILQQRGDDTYLILWGEWVDPRLDPYSNPDGGACFYAPEVPCVQRYPIEPEKVRQQGKRPCLRVRRYCHESQGDFLRCVGFDMKGEEKAQGDDYE